MYSNKYYYEINVALESDHFGKIRTLIYSHFYENSHTNHLLFPNLRPVPVQRTSLECSSSYPATSLAGHTENTIFETIT